MDGKLEVNHIISYWEMCEVEGHRQLQRGMYFKLEPTHSVLLMSIKPNAPYADRISGDGMTIYYEGHDSTGDRFKKLDQPEKNPSGSLTQNGLFAAAAQKGKITLNFDLVRIYEKIKDGIWNYRGLFELRDCNFIDRDGRKVFEFTLTITEQDRIERKNQPKHNLDIEQTRQIPGKVKLEVYKRDKGVCTKCGSNDNLHFDHILPFSLGGTSLKADNIQLLCARHNLEKSDSLIK